MSPNMVGRSNSAASRVVWTRNSMSVLLVGLLFSSERATFASPKTFGRPALVDHAGSPGNRLEGIDYIDLEAFRAEMKPTWKGSYFG